MPRNSSGTYALPVAAFQTGTVIASASMNSNLADIATALTQSVATTGVSPMTGPLLASSGNVGAPGYAFASDTASGFYLAGTHQIGIATNGIQLGTLNADQSVTFNGVVQAQANTNSSGGNLVPIGTIQFYAGSFAPQGWQFCYGQAISRTTYSLLFSIIGTTYGIGDGSTTFNLPDCRGRGLYGKDNMGLIPANRITVGGGNYDGTILGNAGGSQNHTMTQGELVAHSHTGSGNVSDPGHIHAPSSGANFITNSPGVSHQAGAQGTIEPFTASSFTGVTVPSLNINNTGGGNPFTVLSPSIIFNVIIYSYVP